MATITQSKSLPANPLIEPTIATEKYISSKDFFSILRKEVDKYYEGL